MTKINVALRLPAFAKATLSEDIAKELAPRDASLVAAWIWHPEV
jgi:hypothetical protein